jgi:dTDP-4-amino-4,6-dideoxy-D-galactose acyltransferase
MLMDETATPCLFLEWDTNFFGRRIGRLNSRSLSPAVVEQTDAWCRTNAIDCLYFPAEASDPATVRLAEANGFHLVEVRLIFERKLDTWQVGAPSRARPDLVVRPSQASDIPALQEIARSSYVDSRFYFDEHFSEEQWSAYYRHWIAKSVSGGADLALTAEIGGEIAGYITGLIDREKNEGVYELTGVKQSARRAGVGQELFRAGVDWFAEQGFPSMWLATQGRNVPTQRMVQRYGFLTKDCQLYYHKWYSA